MLIFAVSLQDHFQKIQDEARNYEDAIELAVLLDDDVAYRLRRYTKCIAKSTDSYYQWLVETYRRRLRARLRQAYLM